MAKQKKAPKNLDFLPEGGLLGSRKEMKKDLKKALNEETHNGLPKSERKKVTFLMHPSLHKKLKLASVEAEKSISDLLEELILKGA